LFEKNLRRVVDLFLFGNFYLAFCAVGLIYCTYEWIGVPLTFDSLATFVFASTLFQYSLHRLIAMRERAESHNYVIEWSRSNQFLIFMIAIVSGGLAANIAFHLTRESLMVLIPMAILSLLYELPFKFHNKRYKLRNIWYFKTILIVLVWTFTTVVLPFLEHEVNIFNSTFILLFIHRLILILILAIAFDVRDLDYDKAENVNTIPVTFGLFRVKKLYLFLSFLLLVIGVMRVFFLTEISLSYTLVSILTPILTYWIITMSYKHPKDYFYNTIVDGIMLIEVILIILFHLIKL
jgi:4-hydroxybenzoate polyprenyltransferase